LYMLSKQAIFDKIAFASPQLKKYGVVKIGLFGSYVKNKQTAESDVDLLVDFEAGNKTYDNYIETIYYLENLLNAKVELVTRQSLSKFIGPHILKEVEYVAI